ncbi:AsmA family protein [Thalassospira sp. MA62]|nr:AsmA family protein [Thalassospira sp. MA62]
MKKILIGLAVIILLVVAGLVYVYANLDNIVKATIEEAGTRVTLADVTVEGVKIETTQNTADISGLVIGNPEGFQTDYAFSLGDISVRLDGSTLGSDTIRIIEIVVDAPSVTYELGNNSSNIATIQRNVQSFIQRVSGPSGAGGADSDDDGASESAADGTKVIIDDVYVRNGDVSVSASFLQGKKISTNLPEIHLSDVGKEDNGATPAEVAGKILTAINTSVFKSVSNLNVDGLMQGVGDLGKGVIGAVGGAASGGGSKLKDGADALGGAVKGLFGGSSSE